MALSIPTKQSGGTLSHTEFNQVVAEINALGQADAALAAQKGAVNGLASLDGSGKVPASQLPAFVDDVLEYANLAALPATGEAAKLYVTLDTGRTYRWGGSAYTQILASPGTTADITDTAQKRFVTDSEKATWNAAAGAGFSGNYNDLTNKPTLFSGAYNDLTGKPALFSGNYNDLSNKPTIPTIPSNVSAFSNDADYQNATEVAQAISDAQASYSIVFDDQTTTGEGTEASPVGVNTAVIATRAYADALGGLIAHQTTAASAYTIPASALRTIRVTINPASVLTAKTLVFPTGIDGQHLYLEFGGSITSGVVVSSLTLTSSQGILQATTPTEVLAGESLHYWYNATTAKWYRH